MRRAVSTLSVCAGLWLVVVGCATRLPNPTAAPPPLPVGGGVPLLSDEQVTAARTLYVGKCTSCHKFYPPAKYSQAEWNSWMRKMSRKAKLKPTEEETLRNYLALFRR
jgi:hypothetical protein